MELDRGPLHRRVLDDLVKERTQDRVGLAMIALAAKDEADRVRITDFDLEITELYRLVLHLMEGACAKGASS
jgi:phosphate uptake regulator